MSLRRQWLRNNNKIDLDGDIMYTKSTHFIMPMIGYISDNFIGSNGVNYLINCHLDLPNNQVKVIIDNTDDPKILQLLQYNLNNPYYLTFVSDDEEREIVLSYTIPNVHKSDLNIFLTSKYSKMSQKYKKKLIDLYGKDINMEDYRPTRFDILYPTSFKKTQLAERLGVDIEQIDEVAELLNMEYENYKTIEQLLITINKQQNNQEQYESKQ